jgi:hypothetical protein
VTLIAYDSTTPAEIPAGAAAVLPYLDGRYAWSASHLTRFPHAKSRLITVLGDPAAGICDVERGDVPAAAPAVPDHVAAAATAATGGRQDQAAAMAFKAVTARGYIEERATTKARWPGIIYCNRSTLSVVQQHCAGLQYGVLLATLDGDRPRYYSGAWIVGIQYKNVPGKYDMSEIYEVDWLLNP